MPMDRLSEISEDVLDDMARGAALLGAGGGGDPYLGMLVARQAIRESGPVPLVEVEGLSNDDAVYTAAGMGAPTVMLEKLVCGHEIQTALRELEQHLQRPATAIISAEVGGINSMVPVAIAAQRGLPLVDGDGMGRAFPELQMCTFNVYGVPCSPLVVANEHGEYNIIFGRDAKTSENMARQMVIQMGGSIGLSCYAMTGKQAKCSAVRGSLHHAFVLGRAIATGRREGDPFASLFGALDGGGTYAHSVQLFDGKIIDIDRQTRQGFALGVCKLAGSGEFNGSMEITFQNENLAARRDGRTVAMVPDLICIVDRDSAEPITTERLRYGQRVKVLGISAPEILRTPEALSVWGPAAFGIDEEFTPVEQLNIGG